MATSQPLESEINPEVETLSCEVCRESLECLDGKFIDCDSSHENFIRSDMLALDDLPNCIKHSSVLKLIKHNADLTVRVCSPPSSDKKKPMCGSGSVCYFSDTHNLFECHHGDDVQKCRYCHIPGCPYSEMYGDDHFVITSHDSIQKLTPSELSRAHIAFRVSTNEHVVASCHEAAVTKIEFFFDSPQNRSDVIQAQGVCLCGQWREQDKVHIVCVSDRNDRLEQLLQNMRTKFYDIFEEIPKDIKKTLIHKYVVLVSHPHGCSKRISFGENLGSQERFSNLNVPYTMTHYNAASCCGSSGGVVLGPGYIDGGPAYRVHCGRQDNIKFSKSFWVTDNSEAKKVNYDEANGKKYPVLCCPTNAHKALPNQV